MISRALFVAIWTVGVFIQQGSCDGQISKIIGFSWENCGNAKDPAVMKSLDLSPDPINIPGDLTATASGSTSVPLVSPLSVNVTLEKEVAGFWVKVPCVDELGSCHYQDICDLLNQLIPPGQDCPEPLHTYGLPCHCPFKAVPCSGLASMYYHIAQPSISITDECTVHSVETPHISEGDYSLPQSGFSLPEIELPFWLTNGHYRVQGVLGNLGKELGCLKVSLTLHSN